MMKSIKFLLLAFALAVPASAQIAPGIVDCSGTIAAASTAQNVAQSFEFPTVITIQNSHASGTLYVRACSESATTCVAQVGSPSNWLVPAGGGTIRIDRVRARISVISTTAALNYNCSMGG